MTPSKSLRGGNELIRIDIGNWLGKIEGSDRTLEKLRRFRWKSVWEAFRRQRVA
jgi:hypothetical protein